MGSLNGSHLQKADGHIPIKIVYLVSTLKQCGPVNQLLNMTRHLDRGRFHIAILTLSPEPAESMLPLFEKESIRVESLRLGRLKGLFFARRALKAWLAKEKPEIIHSQGFRADLLSVALLARTYCKNHSLTRIATVRNHAFIDYRMTYGWPGWIMAAIHNYALKHIDRVVAVSHSVASALLRSGIPANVIHNGTDCQRFKTMSPEKRFTGRQALGIEREACLFIASGHLSERKDPELIIKASLALPSAHLILLGDGPLGPPLRRRYMAEERIHFLGRRADVERFLGMADLFISTSKSEGLPNAVMEAMACGLPCVLSDISPHKEILSPAPFAGSLVPLASLEALKACLMDAKPHLIERALIRDAAVSFFSGETMSKKYADLYIASRSHVELESSSSSSSMSSTLRLVSRSFKAWLRV